MTTYLITGGAGFIGSHLCERCLKLGHRVICVDSCDDVQLLRLTRVRDHTHLKLVREDVGNISVIRRLVQQADIAIHLAAEPDLDDSQATEQALARNYQNTSTLLAEAVAAGTKCVVASSAEVHLATLVEQETSTSLLGASPCPCRSQTISKLVDECLANESETPTIVARIFPTIGPRQNPRYANLVLDLFERALAHEDLIVPEEGQFECSYIHVSDVVHWLLLLSQTDQAYGQTFDIGSPSLVRDLDLAAMVRRITDAPVQIISAKPLEASSTREPIRPDLTNIKQVTGYAPRVQLDEALRRIHEWLLDERSTNAHWAYQ